MKFSTPTQVSLDDLREIASILQCGRFPLTDEKRTQTAIAEGLISAKKAFQREFRLSPKEIIDFMLDKGVGLEIKIKGQRMAIFRQLERYAEIEQIQGLILATSVSMHLPKEIKGKPVLVASLSQGWL